jgi:ketosteroid isomerase-like protein
MKNNDWELIARAYEAFNTRDIDTALALMRSDVEWPNGMEGGYVYGRLGVRNYWTRQWKSINPQVEPVRYNLLADGRMKVEVHQIVRDLGQQIIQDQTVYHVYSIDGGLIRKMEIVPAEAQA